MLQTHSRSRGALLTLLFLVAVMPLLAACGGSTTAAGLDGSHWNLSAMKAHDGGATPPLPGTALTLEISGDTVSGSSGCNTYSGSVKHDNGAFTVGGQFAVTQKACSPTEIMDQEQQYLTTLQTAKTYQIDGDSLFLYDSAHAPILSYVRSDAVPLTNTLWRMTSYSTGADTLTPAPQGAATLTVFNTNGQVTGAMGGQAFNAPYQTSSDTMTISAPQSAGDNEQLNSFLSALTSAKKYAISGLQLVLTGGDGRPVVVFADTARSPALVNTTWFLRKFDFSAGLNSVASALNVTLNFDGNGKLNGAVDCNTYQGTYGTSGAKIGIGDIQVTQNTCSNDKDALDQAAKYPGLLPLGTGFGIFGTHLLLTKSDGSPLAEYVAIFDQPSLNGTNWRLLAYHGNSSGLTRALEGAEVTACFDGRGGLTGSAGCNTYQADYSANKDSLTIQKLSSTNKACDSPAGVMEQEQQYLAGLPSVATFTVAGPTLQLFTRDGAIFAIYQATPPSTELPLVNTSWYLQDFKLASGAILGVSNPRDYTLAFAPDGHLTIKADCNSGTGSYTVDGGNISIKVLAMTQVACSANSLSGQFLQALTQATTYLQTNDTLTLTIPPKGELRFLTQK